MGRASKSRNAFILGFGAVWWLKIPKLQRNFLPSFSERLSKVKVHGAETTRPV